jgi:subtilase family serine protease
MNLFTAIAANEIDLAIQLDSAALEAEDAELRAMLLEIAKGTMSDAEFAEFEASMRVVGPVQAAIEEEIEALAHVGKFRSGAAQSSRPSAAVGSGQKIGLAAFSSIRLSDVADWLALTDRPANLLGQVTKIDVNGGAPVGPNQSEVLLAINTILGLAPGVKIVVYDAPSTGSGSTSFQALFNKMIGDHVTIVSNSFGYCEDQTTLADVETIDTVLATAAASGISVFNATGDSGSACSDGNANTIAVPADSPNATAVGGTSPVAGPGSTYQGEKWFSGSGDTVPTGQGGFGVSRFFSRPSYQSGVISGAMRSVPDIADFADPKVAPTVCEADAGGCPTNHVFGGTSLATPVLAAYVAMLNQILRHPLGMLNPHLYALAGSSSFHSPASMGSDVAHVGLGSANMDLLYLALAGLSVGAPSASVSSLTAASAVPRAPFFGAVPADGATTGSLVVRLQDAKQNMVGRP